MRTIYKYPLAVAEHFEIEMPRGALMLSVAIQGTTPCLWAEVDTDQPQETCHFAIAGTGRPLPEREGCLPVCLGMFMQAGGALVWHVYELLPYVLMDDEQAAGR